jgi:hypothetical protein
VSTGISRFALWRGALLSFFVVVDGCAPQAAADPPPPLRHIAEVHKARCGNCHVRVEPGARTRDEFEAALPRHHERVHLTDDEWAELLEYLAPARPSPAPG